MSQKAKPDNTDDTEEIMSAQELRSRYPIFYLDSTELKVDGDDLVLETLCHTEGYEFVDVVRFKGPNLSELFAQVQPDIIERLNSVAGFIIATSYWKAFISPTFDTSSAALIETRSGFWDRFMLGSFGEFSYRNDLSHQKLGGPLVTVKGTTAHRKRPIHWPRDSHPLVLYSGGKDSSAALELFDNESIRFSQILFNPSDKQREEARSHGAVKTYEITRALDPQIFELNKEGYFNGHTPFSAMLAALGLILASVTGHNQVVAANTRSDETSNLFWQGLAINHQWTKSIEFERMLKELTDAIGGPSYVALFRPLYELQLMSRLDSRSFISCNRLLKEGNWCGVCPKCIWIWLAVAAIDNTDAATSLIGSDPRGKPETLPTLRSMAGLANEHPFECTGSPEEVAAVLDELEMDISEPGAQEVALANATLDEILSSWGDDSLLPTQWVDYVRSYQTTP